MRERFEGMESPCWCICRLLIFTWPYLLDSCLLVAYHLGRGGMPLYYAVVVNCKNGATVQKSRRRCLVYRRLPLRGGWRRSWLIIIF